MEGNGAPLPPGEPAVSVSARGELLTGYLDYSRASVLRKLDGLSEDELRRSRVPSGWSPLELVRHLTFVERRWLCWGFRAEQVSEPWGDADGDDRWYVPRGTSVAGVLDGFRAQVARSREIVDAAPAGALAGTGGRFPTEAEAPSLEWILFHLLQEYARHLGQLDVVREPADGTTGE